MEVRKYRAKTIEEATSKVKTELGPDAMILSTRKMEGKTGSALFEIAAIPAGNTHEQSQSSLNEVKSELMSIKDMIYILNHSSGIAENLIHNPDILALYAALVRNAKTRETLDRYRDLARSRLDLHSLGDGPCNRHHLGAADFCPTRMEGAV